jgi:phenylalanyl-tRNA synthetase beta chain
VHRFPVAPFDVAVVVPRRTSAARVAEAIAAAAPGQVRSVRVFDVYEGAGIPAGSRSLAFACELLDPAGTLGPAQAEALRRRIQQALEAAGWNVRAAART